MTRLLAPFAVLVVALGVLLGFAGPAAAHVTVNSPGATQGGYAVLTFRVPNESATASTTKLAVQFPPAQPISSVLVQAQPGWTYEVTKAKLDTPVPDGHGGQITEAVSEITWTADSDATVVKPGEFAEFRVSAGPLPKVDVLRFGALQTYSDGDVVAWNEEAAPGSSASPTHPKPALTLAAAAGADKSAGDPASSSDSDGGSGTTGTVALVLSIIALLLAGAALGTGLLRTKRGRA